MQLKLKSIEDVQLKIKERKNDFEKFEKDSQKLKNKESDCKELAELVLAELRFCCRQDDAIKSVVEQCSLRCSPRVTFDNQRLSHQ